MAVQISGTTVIDNSRNIVNVNGVGDAATTIYYGDGSNLKGLSTATFNDELSSSTYVGVTGGQVGGSTATINNIFAGPTAALTFPSTANRRYIINSIHLTNKYSNEVYVVGRVGFNGGAQVPIAQRLILPYQGSMELLEQPLIANPSDIIYLQAVDGSGSSAVRVDSAVDAFIVYTEKVGTNYVGAGVTVTSTDQVVYTSTSPNKTTLQSIRITNYSLIADADASISIFNASGVRVGYLAYNLTIPKNSVVDLIASPKFLNAGFSLRATSTFSTGIISVTVAGKTFA